MSLAHSPLKGDGSMIPYVFITKKDAMKLLSETEFIEQDIETSNYALVEVKAGTAHHIRFHNIGNREEFIIFTHNSQKLFCNNDYLGGLLVVIEHGRIHKIINFCVRANAIVLADCVAAPYITPIGNCSDIVIGYELCSEQNLRHHFRLEYCMLLEDKPEEWEEEMQKLLKTKTCIDIVDGHLAF